MHDMKGAKGVKHENLVWGQVVKALEYHNSWNLDFVP